MDGRPADGWGEVTVRRVDSARSDALGSRERAKLISVELEVMYRAVLKSWSATKPTGRDTLPAWGPL